MEVALVEERHVDAAPAGKAARGSQSAESSADDDDAMRGGRHRCRCCAFGPGRVVQGHAAKAFMDFVLRPSLLPVLLVAGIAAACSTTGVGEEPHTWVSA